MTFGAPSQCSRCARFRSPFSDENVRNLDDPFCAAFPDGIPNRIYNNAVDHRKPVDGDHGLQWIPLPGQEFPTAAFLPQYLSKS